MKTSGILLCIWAGLLGYGINHHAPIYMQIVLLICLVLELMIFYMRWMDSWD